jgi:hypothetical protein
VAEKARSGQFGRRTRRLLALLVAAGEDGLTTSRLAFEIGHRFPEYVRRLRAAGVVISVERLSASVTSERVYRLDGPVPADLRRHGALEVLEQPILSARQGYRFVSERLRRGTPEDRAAVRDLLAHQPELAMNRSIRHNLAGKVRLLDEIARELGIETGDAS